MCGRRAQTLLNTRRGLLVFVVDGRVSIEMYPAVAQASIATSAVDCEQPVFFLMSLTS